MDVSIIFKIAAVGILVARFESDTQEGGAG